MAKTEKRVLRFFVSGALLAGSAACSKNKSETEETVEGVNEGPVDQDTLEKHVNEGPVVVPKTAPIDASISAAIKDPDRVNTNHIGPDGENLNPTAHPATPDRTNTNRQEPLSVAPKAVPKRPDRTNTNRQVPPPKAVPKRPDRTNTNREFEVPTTPVTPDKP